MAGVSIADLLKKQGRSPLLAPLALPQTNLTGNNGGIGHLIQNIGGLGGGSSLIGSGSSALTAAPALDPKVVKAQNLNNRDMIQAGNLGIPVTGKRPSLIHRVFDILSRPEYSVFDAALQGTKAYAQGDNIGQTLERTAGGLLHGIAGTHKTQIENIVQYVKDANHAASVGKSANQIVTGEGGKLSPLEKIGSTIGDVALDPNNLVGGLGVESRLVKGGVDLADHAGEGAKALESLVQRFPALQEILKPGEGKSLLAPAEHVPTVDENSLRTQKIQQVLDASQPMIHKQEYNAAHNAAIDAGKSYEKLPSLKYDTAPKSSAYDRVLLGADTLPTGARTISEASKTARAAAKSRNTDLANEIAAKANASAAKAHSDIQDKVLEDLARSNNPASVKQISLKLKGLDGRIPLTPKFITTHLDRLNGTPVGDMRNAFSHMFISTGNMSPEMQAVAGRDRGLMHGPHNKMIADLSNSFKGSRPEDVKTALHSVINNDAKLGSNPELEAAIDKHLAGYLGELRDAKAHNTGVKMSDFNAYLPTNSKMKLQGTKMLAHTALNEPRPEEALKAFKALLGPTLERSAAAGHHPIDYLGTLGNASIKMRAKKTIIDELQNRFGVPLMHGGVNSPVADRLIEKSGYRGVKGLPKTHVFSPEVAKDAERMLELHGSYQSGEELTKGIFKAVSVWKRLATIYNLPSYPTRNFVTNEIMSNLIGGVHARDQAKATAMAAKFMRHRLDKETAGNMDPVRAVLDKQLSGEIGGKHGPLFIDKELANEVPGGAVMPEVVDAQMRKQGLESTFTGSQQYSNHASLQTGIRGKIGALNQKVIQGNKNIEDFSRAKVFIHHLRTGTGTLDQRSEHAASMVRKSLFDYNDVTPGEQKQLVKLFPFYKWNRKAIPALFQGLLDHPGKVLGTQEAIRGGVLTAGGQQPDLKDPWGLNTEPLHRIPSYILDRMSIPFGGANSKGGHSYLDPSTPFNDELRLIGDPSSMLSQVTPLARVPTELIMRKQFYHDIPIKNPLAYSTIDQVNLLRNLTKASTTLPVGAQGTTTQGQPGVGSTFLSNLLNTLNPVSSSIGKQSNTPKSQASALLNSNTKLAAEIKKAKAARRAKILAAYNASTQSGTPVL